MNVSIPFIRNIHTNYTLPSNVTFSSISHNSSPTSSSGFSSRFPPTLLDSHTATNLVIYIVPAVFGFGIIVALVWWIHLSSKRRARGGAFAKNVNDVEARIAPIPPSLSLFASRPSSTSLNTILEKSLEPPTIPPLVFCIDSPNSLPPTYSSDWKVASRVAE